MDSYIDKDELVRTIKQFYILTNLKVTVFGTNHEVLAEYPITHCNEFCSYLNLTDAGKKLCEESNWEAFERCTNKKVYVYHCHAGLYEVIAPLVQSDELIGYIMFGQFTIEEDRPLIEEKLKDLKRVVNFETAISLIPQIKCQDIKTTNAQADILSICCKYFITNEIIKLNSSLVTYQVLNYIHQHYSEDFSIDTLCDTLNISRTKAYDVFKKEKNIGLMEYVTNLKMSKAKDLLENSAYSIKEITYMIGLHSSNQFINIFKKKFNITPKQYQKKI